MSNTTSSDAPSRNVSPSRRTAELARIRDGLLLANSRRDLSIEEVAEIFAVRVDEVVKIVDGVLVKRLGGRVPRNEVLWAAATIVWTLGTITAALGDDFAAVYPKLLATVEVPVCVPAFIVAEWQEAARRQYDDAECKTCIAGDHCSEHVGQLIWERWYDTSPRAKRGNSRSEPAWRVAAAWPGDPEEPKPAGE